MNNQNILKFYGSRLDLKLDSSEFYDVELSKNEDDYATDVLNFSSPIIYTGLTLSGLTLSGCSTTTTPILVSRPVNGWTLDFIFNRNGYPWISGGTFYYLGLVDNNERECYADDNLSFGFTNDGRIKWGKIHYSGYCNNSGVYEDFYYIRTGQTPVLCTTGDTKDFNVTIVFERYNGYTGCDLENEGGINDLITGQTSNISEMDIITGGTPEYTYHYGFSKKWADGRDKRLGVLKIYLNSRLIYTHQNWEEVIPADRCGYYAEQIWGGGTPLMFDIHDGICCFTIKSISQYQDPLNFTQIYHNFKFYENNYDYEICGEECVDEPYGFDNRSLLTELSEKLLTENNTLILY